ncbi:MAG: insulinase family protein [Myxococcales bacterium]|nr:insulinase family protein [Myxococcales bacterium]
MTTSLAAPTATAAASSPAPLGRGRASRALALLAAGALTTAALAAGACTRGQGTTPPGGRTGLVPTPVDGGTDASGRTWPAPPPPTAPKPVVFPEVGTFRLANGLSVYVVENHEVPLVSAELVIRCGTMDDPHLASFTAAMLGEGTRSRSKAKLDEAIEFVGGTLGAGASTHTSTVHARSLDKDLKLAMLLMADEVQNPVFPPEALGKLKQTAKSALRINRSQPDVLADTLLDDVIYPDGHPYGRPLGTDAQIDAITLDDIRRFHETFYRANNGFLLLSGAITLDEAKPLVERAFGGWAAAEPSSLPPNPLNVFTRYELPGELRVHLVDRPDSAQATIRVGNLALARNHEDWAALQVANEILGGGPNARLFQDIREERSLTYGISSKVGKGQAPSTFVIATETRTPTTGEMLAAIFEHIERLRTEQTPRREFEATVRKIVGAFPLEVETAEQVVDLVREQLVYGLPPSYWKDYRQGITEVELSEVRKAALRYIHALPVVVVVGNAAQIRPQLSQVLPTATIVEYDAVLRRK